MATPSRFTATVGRRAPTPTCPDVVEANILAADAKLPAGGHTVLNVGTAQETSVNEIAEAIGGPVQHIIPQSEAGIRGSAQGG